MLQILQLTLFLKNGKGFKMKIFEKVRTLNGRKQIYFCGIKVFSYKKTNLKLYLKKYIKAKTLFYFSKCFSETKQYHIDVVIPTTTKDIHKLSKVIPSFSNIQHYIDNIYIISPKSEYVLNFCKENNLIFINEDTVLPITLKDINYSPNGVSRSGWIFQQLLKLNIDTFCKNEHILVADSDTVFQRKQYFIKNDKIVFDVGLYKLTYGHIGICQKVVGLDILGNKRKEGCEGVDLFL